ncbi:hypothetical protein C5B96_16810, partial [Subtercola sp. Z020]|uniref:hypothetical protein n=1 Tax=Subtercola sp. Z020 TaxID=2080582 RepID=UPI000D4AC341
RPAAAPAAASADSAPDAATDAPETDPASADANAEGGFAVPDVTPTDSDTAAAADPATLELQDELNSIRALGEDLHG